jgi:hypothetical protein
VLLLTLTSAALALNIEIGGSVGNIPASNLVTVQDSGLTSQVWCTGLLDYLMLNSHQCQSICGPASSTIQVSSLYS